MSMQSVASPASRSPRRSASSLPHIPGDEGWPLIGRRSTCSPTPRARSSGRPRNTGWSIAAMCSARPASRCSGPRPTSWCCSTRPSCSPRPMAGDRFSACCFRAGLMLLDFEEHRLHRRALSVAFKSGPMKSYLAELDTGIAARVAQWKAQPGPMLFYPAMKQLTLDLAATSFLGADIGPEVDEITRAFVDMVAASVARDPQAAARHADGARRQRPRAHRRLFLRADSDPPRQGAAKTCSRSYAAPPTRTARCCRPRTSSTT